MVPTSVRSSPETPGPTPRTFVFGLLGGIASGKSLAARLLVGEDGLVLSADEIAHGVLASDEVTALVLERFGPAALGPDGRPDRARLATLVFDSEDGTLARRCLEDWIHPRVRARISLSLREAREAGVPRIALDIPLLLENDAQHRFTSDCDALVFVDSAPEARDERAQSTRGWSPGEVARREGAQLSLSEKRERAGHVLSNLGDVSELEQAVLRLLERLHLA